MFEQNKNVKMFIRSRPEQKQVKERQQNLFIEFIEFGSSIWRQSSYQLIIQVAFLVCNRGNDITGHSHDNQLAYL